MVAMGRRSPLQYVVLWLATDTVLYRGPSLTGVSHALEYGTVWGEGRTQAEALEQATFRAASAKVARQKSAQRWVNTPVRETVPARSDPSPEEIAARCREVREGWGERWD